MATPPDDLTLPDRLRLAGFELILQGSPPWLYSAPYDAARLLETPDGAAPPLLNSFGTTPLKEVRDDRALA